MQGEDNGTVHCLDLGSGKGGASRWLAKTYGCKITAFNLGERQNAFNLERAKADGIGHLVETHLGSFNEPLPADWTDKYDMVCMLRLCNSSFSVRVAASQQANNNAMT
jgi:cyclopropane fatty-acyl-phospholipid synthase-like methyltransferase